MERQKNLIPFKCGFRSHLIITKINPLSNKEVEKKKKKEIGHKHTSRTR